MFFRFLLFMFVGVAVLNPLFAQQDTVKWIPSGTIGLNLSQVTFENWAKGGDNSLSYTGLINMGLIYQKDHWKVDNQLKLAYGRTKLGDDDYKTTENELHFVTVVSFKSGHVLDPYFANTIRTSVSTGFDYKQTPSLAMTDFFDPGYVTQSLGFTFNPVTNFSTRAGLAIQETFADKFRAQFTDDLETKDKTEAFRFETGIEMVTQGSTTVVENVLLDSKLRLFTRFEELSVWDVRWDNNFTAKINSFLNVNLNIIVMYEQSQVMKTQFKEALQIGFVYSIF